MKRLTILLFVCILLAGCAKNTQTGPSPSETTGETENLKVVASFYPMADFAEKVGGEYVEVYTMVPSGIDAHDWEPSAADIITLENCDVFIYHGLGMEHWVDTALAAIDTSDILVIEASEGAWLVEGQYRPDPHTWLSIPNAVTAMENIKNGFTAIDPDRQEYYESNFQRYEDVLGDLYQKYESTLAEKTRDIIIVPHPAFHYICVEFGLNMYALEESGDHGEPDPRNIAYIISLIEEQGIPAIFYDGHESPKGIETVQEATGVLTLPLYAIESLTQEQIDKGEDYISLMEQNLESLVQALL